jgi:regulator of replication initiation timing
MFKKIQERIFPFIIATSALSVSASAAFYSVSGLSKLFAGAAFAVIIMATSLEVAKLVIASLLYQYRKTIPRLLKYYLSVAAVVLVLITSMGIYGFLSSAYQETAAKAGSIDSQIALIETKRDNVKEQLAVYNEEKTSINTAVSDLRSGLSNNKIQYRDRETGQIITTTSSSTRRALEKQLDQAIFRQTEINTKVDVLNEQLFKYETEIVEVKTGNDIAGELGPLKYLSGLTGIPMDRIINYLLLTIIFVFDPLAIALVIAANFAFEKLRPKTKENIYGEKEVIDDGMWTEEEMEDFRNQFNADHLIPDEDEVKINPQLQINFDQRIPDLENQITQLNNELIDFKNKISAVVMFDGLEEEPTPTPTEEEYVEAKMKDFRANMILGEFRRRRLESSLKEEYKKKKDNDEDLTITY